MINSRSSVTHWLWTHNPFYVISSLLMLYGVRASYRGIEIGEIDCWLMMGVLAAYTLLLAIVGVLIIRWGKVWDDARSILLLLLLLFLAISVSADDLFVKMESTSGGAALLICGFGYSVIILTLVLRAAQIRLKLVYVVPLILFLALFFVTPWWCSPELHPKDMTTLDWTVFLFPQIAAVLMLTLIPAVRMGQSSISGSGTPWPWPLFPWSAFGFIGVAVVVRSYALTMTFSQSGPIWTSPESRIGIVFDTIWRPYFLVPFVFASLLLIFEAGLTSDNRKLVRRALIVAPSLLLLAWPWNPSFAMLGFLGQLTRQIGSPVWITVWLLGVFYSWAIIRRVPMAEIGLLFSLLIFSVVGPQTINSYTFTTVNPVPIYAVGMILGTLGITRRSALLTLAAVSLVTTGIWVVLTNTSVSAYRPAICYHLMLATCLLLSVVMKDRVAIQLQSVGAILLILPAILTFDRSILPQVPWELRIVYIATMAGISLVCARHCRGHAYWASFVVMIGVFCYSIAIEGYRSATLVIGRSAVAAFSWSVGTLMIGVLISAHKARWLPSFAWISRFGNQPPSTPIVPPQDGS